MSDVRVFDSATQGGTSWSREIIGVTYFGNNPSNHPIIIMLVSGDAFGWLIGFNNIQVTITKVEGGQSSLKGVLIAGQSETIRNWRHSGWDEMNTNISPGYAAIDITFRPQPQRLRRF